MVIKSPQKQLERKEYTNSFQQSRQEVSGAIQVPLESSNYSDIAPIDNSAILQKKIAKYSKQTEKPKGATSAKFLNDDFSSKRRADYTRPSASQPQTLFKTIIKATKKLLAGGAVFLGVCLAYHYCYTRGQINQSEKAELETIQLLKKEKNSEECVNNAKVFLPRPPFYTDAQNLLNDCQSACGTGCGV
ncbi:MAG: hypothetical protein JO235_13690 [Chroococcidiopsidaceae cyanobacterium CP_BM_RX_35]|nr:hypothetical protein [Chroococcidiopsidaceae cyanobacterium CP_BM_RX_35]